MNAYRIRYTNRRFTKYANSELVITYFTCTCK